MRVRVRDIESEGERETLRVRERDIESEGERHLE